MYHIYIYQTLIDEELESVFQNLNHLTTINKLSESILKITIEPSLTEELIDFNMLHASIVSDFDMDTTLIYFDEIVYDFIDESMILNHIHLFNHTVYDISSCIIFLSRYADIKYRIKRQLVDLLGQDYINTIAKMASANMNLSIAAKRLYLHRNSLNYRIDKIAQKTTIDVKSFNGLRALMSIIEA